MSWLVCACGAFLAVAGAASVLYGAPYIRMEFGWTEVIAGTTAFTGGLVIVTLGVVLHRLKALQAALVGRSAAPERPAPLLGPAAAMPEADAPPPSLEPEAVATPPERREADAPPPPNAAEPPPPRPSLLARLGPRRGEVVPARAAVAPRPEPAVADDVKDVAPEPDALPAEPDGAAFHRVGIEDVAAQPERSPRDGAGEREVVGRYEAGGASYALFSDGTIEVTTANGSRRFGSMEELRAYVESQDADRAALAP